MSEKRTGVGPWLSERVAWPRWFVLFLFLITIFNGIIFVSIVLTYWRPDIAPVPITGDVVIGLHLQLFEAFLAALAIGIAVTGFVGYATLKEAAERRAEETAREVAQSVASATRPEGYRPSDNTPDLTGIGTNGAPADREPEEGI